MDAHPPLRDHSDVIDALGGRAVVAEALGETPACVGMWKSRRRLPPKVWPAVSRLAATAGRADITIDRIERLAGAAA